MQKLDPNLVLNLGLYVFMAVLIWRTTKLQPIVLFMHDSLSGIDTDNTDIDFVTLPTAGAVEETGNVCIWCGKAYPVPVNDEDPEPSWYEAQKSWVMISYGSGDVTKVSCCTEHMEQYIMIGKQ